MKISRQLWDGFKTLPHYQLILREWEKDLGSNTTPFHLLAYDIFWNSNHADADKFKQFFLIDILPVNELVTAYEAWYIALFHLDYRGHLIWAHMQAMRIDKMLIMRYNKECNEVLDSLADYINSIASEYKKIYDSIDWSHYASN